MIPQNIPLKASRRMGKFISTTMGRRSRSTAVDDHTVSMNEALRSSATPRPDKYTPKDWQRIPHERRKEIIKVQEMEAGAERERRKVERKVKEAEDKAVEEKEKKDRIQGQGPRCWSIC